MLLLAVKPQFLVRQEAENLSSDVALEASHRFLLGQPLLLASIDVLGGSRVVDHPGEHDVPEGGVGLAITAAVEAVSLILPATGVERCGITEVGEGRLVTQASGIVAGRDEQRRRSVGPYAESGDKFGCGLFCQGLEDGVDSLISSSRVRARRANMCKLDLVKETTSRLAPGR